MSISEFLLSERIFPAVCVLVGVAMGHGVALLTPWISWGIEQRRLRHQARKETIDRWRRMVQRVSADLGHEDDFGELFLALYANADFLSLEPHIGRHTKSLLDGGEVHNHVLFSSLLADIAAIEKEWGIL